MTKEQNYDKSELSAFKYDIFNCLFLFSENESVMLPNRDSYLFNRKLCLELITS